MKTWLPVVAALLFACVGCKKKPETPPPPPTPTATADTPATPPPTPQVAPAVSQPTPTPAPQARPAVQPNPNLKPIPGRVDAYMTAALQRFIAAKGHMPGSIVELYTATMDSMPPAPAGYYYVIDPATVQVKVVKP